MSTQVFDDEGNEVFPVTINTVCPIEHEQDARQISFEYMAQYADDVTIERDGASYYAQLFPDRICPVGTNIPTHIFCSRRGYTHEVKKQADFAKKQNLDWMSGDILTIESDKEFIKSHFCTIVGDKQSVLNFLEMNKTV